MNLFRGKRLFMLLIVALILPQICSAQSLNPTPTAAPTTHDALLILNSLEPANGLNPLPPQPNIVCTITMVKTPVISSPQQRAFWAQKVKDNAYDIYINLCVTRALMSLPIPTIVGEQAEQNEIDFLPLTRVDLEFKHSLWLDDPLDALPGPSPDLSIP